MSLSKPNKVPFVLAARALSTPTGMLSLVEHREKDLMKVIENLWGPTCAL